MVLIAGARQVSRQTLPRAVGQSRLTMASEEELLRVTGYAMSAVSPFGLQTPMPILADVSAFVPTEVSIGSGVRGTTVILKSADLKRALGALQVGHFAAPRENQ